MINKQILEQYAKIKSEIKLLEEKADELNPQILEMMQAEEVGEIAIGDLGKLTIGSRRTWKYSNEVKELEIKLKEEKKLEEQTGKADYIEKQYILFKGNKENEL